jgi:hypothetical protein
MRDGIERVIIVRGEDERWMKESQSGLTVEGERKRVNSFCERERNAQAHDRDERCKCVDQSEESGCATRVDRWTTCTKVKRAKKAKKVIVQTDSRVH